MSPNILHIIALSGLDFHSNRSPYLVGALRSAGEQGAGRRQPSAPRRRQKFTHESPRHPNHSRHAASHPLRSSHPAFLDTPAS